MSFLRNLTVFMCFMLFVSFCFISCSENEYSGEWVAKINGEKIYADELDAMYYAQQKQLYNVSKEEIDRLAGDPEAVRRNRTLNKAEFLENLIRQRLVYEKARNSKIQDNAEVKAMIKMTREAVIVGQYVKEKFENDISNVSDKEVASIYAREKNKLKGMPIDQAEQLIRQQLMQQRLEEKLHELVESLKEEGKIEKNTSAIRQAKSADQPGSTEK